MTMIRTNIFKHNILNFQKQTGIWSCLSNNIVVEILSVVGFDWIVIDMEHCKYLRSDSC